MLTIKTILHPTDFSENADFAFRLACALAWDYKARLVVLHVVAPPPMVGYAEGIVPIDPLISYDGLRAKLREVRAKNLTIAVEHRLTEGDAATEVLATAKEMPCDLIVIGTHGRTGLSRLLMGSVAEQVLRRADCPVVTVRRPFRETRAPEAGAAVVLAGVPVQH